MEMHESKFHVDIFEYPGIRVYGDKVKEVRGEIQYWLSQLLIRIRS